MASESVPAVQGKHDVRIIAAVIAALVIVWGFVLSLPWIALRWFPVQSNRDVERIKSVLGQLGTYGDMFGALTCLFTGLAFVGAGYAVILQLRALRHQQDEIERNERDWQAAEDARQRESRDVASWERRTAILNSTSFLAQVLTSKLAREDEPEKRSVIENQLEESIIILSTLLEKVSKEHIAE